FFSSRRRHTRWPRDWSSDVCSSDLVAEMQHLGLAEADPAHDLDGWDQAVKIVILANVLMGRNLRPADVERTPVAAVDPSWLRQQIGRASCRERVESGEGVAVE